MDFDLKISNDDITVYCSNGLKLFSDEFINFYNKNIELIKQKLMIEKKTPIIVALIDNEKDANFVYGKSDFSGFYNDTGAFAYINLYGTKDKDYMFKGLLHEITHHLYKYYVYGKDLPRITWVDEGIAQFISDQRKEDIELKKFLKNNMIDEVNLNGLHHDDRSFGNNNGYNLSYIAIKYLFETNDPKKFLEIISDYNKLIEIGENILQDAKQYYKIKIR